MILPHCINELQVSSVEQTTGAEYLMLCNYYIYILFFSQKAGFVYNAKAVCQFGEQSDLMEKSINLNAIGKACYLHVILFGISVLLHVTYTVFSHFLPLYFILQSPHPIALHTTSHHTIH